MIAKYLGMVAAALLLFACQAPPPGAHALEGGWLAQDGTIFVFRPDGTFHGADFRRREIWGNWVRLSDQRVGFQSLLHDSYYLPQYAIINATNADAMDYIITSGNSFIPARRVDPLKAEAAVELIIAPQLHHPRPPASSSQDQPQRGHRGQPDGDPFE